MALNPHTALALAEGIIVPILPMKTLRLREVKSLALGHTAHICSEVCICSVDVSTLSLFLLKSALYGLHNKGVTSVFPHTRTWSGLSTASARVSLIQFFCNLWNESGIRNRHKKKLNRGEEGQNCQASTTVLRGWHGAGGMWNTWVSLSHLCIHICMYVSSNCGRIQII